MASSPYDRVLANVGKHINLDAKETRLFLSLLTEKKLDKKELLQREGERCDHISYVDSGALRAFYRGADGKESTIMFAVTDWWVTDMYAFINEKPAMTAIETIQQSKVFRLKKSDLDQLFVKVSKFERFFRIVMQNAYIREQVRVIQNFSESAEERYRSFLVKYPQVVPLVKQKQIATYLGITPEFLSSLKRKIKK